jgi:hypothetical protein
MVDVNTIMFRNIKPLPQEAIFYGNKHELISAIKVLNEMGYDKGAKHPVRKECPMDEIRAISWLHHNSENMKVWLHRTEITEGDKSYARGEVLDFYEYFEPLPAYKGFTAGIPFGI